ncbi:DUF2971 domain-containing protein [Dyella humicola]|uniref:DUF2971 domain-containing protein n=1 Tax=Dyella humicola TaxID=2992126 RepID=UPI0022509C21|nr:DUF2971 domain-containing protein [Dyella humicola]
MDKPAAKPIRLYHFTSKEFAIQDIVKQRLKIARIMELNDPFEFVGADLENRMWRATMNGMKEAYNDKFGLICFSRTWRDPVQWSHYADHHKGICLGFDVPPHLPVQVNYVRSRSPIPIAPHEINLDPDDPVLTEIFKSAMRTKFAHWSYEDEFRLFTDLNEAEYNVAAEKNLYFANFNVGLTLREVIVGANCTSTPEEISEALTEYKGVVVRKARPAYRTFRMVEQKHELYWKYPPERSVYDPSPVIVINKES